METPLQIDLQGIDAKPDIRAEIDKHVAQLEERSAGCITAGRVVVQAPSGHHRTGGRYEITIYLSLPEGREVNIGRTPQNDERYADIDYALNDAFKRARRQLGDEVRKMQGQVKHHEEFAKGAHTFRFPSGGRDGKWVRPNVRFGLKADMTPSSQGMSALTPKSGHFLSRVASALCAITFFPQYPKRLADIPPMSASIGSIDLSHEITRTVRICETGAQAYIRKAAFGGAFRQWRGGACTGIFSFQQMGRSWRSMG